MSATILTYLTDKNIYNKKTKFKNTYLPKTEMFDQKKKKKSERLCCNTLCCIVKNPQQCRILILCKTKTPTERKTDMS